MSSMFGLGGGDSKDARKQQLMQSIQQQQNMANATRLIEMINENCFEKCVPKPGTSLSSSENTCLSNCMQKYLGAWNTVSGALIQRIKNDPETH